MANHMDNGLGSVIKSLSDVVMPAIDPADPIAKEQLGLAIEFLAFLRERLDLVMPQLEYELDQNRALAHAALDIVDAPRGQALAKAVSAVRDVHCGKSSADDLRQASRAIAEAVDELVRQLASDKSGLRARVERAVIERSAELLAFERSWYEPLAVDVDMGALPHYSTYLNVAAYNQGMRS
ncbi:hypothetical protein [Hydrogenophaga sp. BPS33]|uniref:hypothetical protein n=1 Tax=Hydrogenophaga sp. BPS33 TaxID=2651974 RepID=UPI00131F56AB|nr:hypothetical protein [Hydrogenophaga sp. BPS33]QHE84300.1 hypothetical protein F9K07_05060 [Hydrogenophaga sp. BPS33]